MALVEMASSRSGRYRDARLEVDFERRTAWLDRQPLPLTRKEYDLLAALVANVGEVVRRDALLSSVWGYRREVRTRTLDVHIRRVRQKLGAGREPNIETVFGVGYRFQPCRLNAFEAEERALGA